MYLYLLPVFICICFCLNLYLFIVFICICYLLAFVLVAWPLSIFALLLDSDLSFCAAVFRLCTLYHSFFYIYLTTLRLLLNCTDGSAISKINEQFSYSRTPLALNQCSALSEDQRPLCGFHFQIQSGLHNYTIALLLALFYIFAVSVCIEVLCTALLCTASLCTAWLCGECVVFIAVLCWPQSRIFFCTVWLCICKTPMQLLLEKLIVICHMWRGKLSEKHFMSHKCRYLYMWLVCVFWKHFKSCRCRSGRPNRGFASSPKIR